MLLRIAANAPEQKRNFEFSLRLSQHRLYPEFFPRSLFAAMYFQFPRLHGKTVICCVKRCVGFSRAKQRREGGCAIVSDKETFLPLFSFRKLLQRGRPEEESRRENRGSCARGVCSLRERGGHLHF